MEKIQAKVIFFILILSSLTQFSPIVLPQVHAQNPSFGYTSLETVKIYDISIEQSLYFDQANYHFITPYGNYTWLQPSNIMSFTNFMGEPVIDKSFFVLQYDLDGSWLPLLNFDNQQIITNTTHYLLTYDVMSKKNKGYVLGSVAIDFHSIELNKPKISVSFTRTQDWDIEFGDPDFRWIWDIVPDEDWIYWKNDTLVDITTLSEDVIVNSTTRVSFTDNSSRTIQSILDVSDYSNINFTVGKTFWNSDGFVGVFPVNVADIDPIVYTQAIEDITPADTTGWQEVDAGSAPADSVAEIIACSLSSGTAVIVGVRDTAEAVTKSLTLNEAEDG